MYHLTPPDTLVSYIGAPDACELQYRCRAVLVDQSGWHLLCCTVEALDLGAKVKLEASHDYGAVLLFGSLLDAKACAKFVEAAQQGKVSFGGHSIERRVAPAWQEQTEVQGNDTMTRAGRVVRTAFEHTTPNISPDAFVRPGLPHYDDLAGAARDWLPFRSYYGYSDARNGNIVFLLPEMRAYFGSVERRPDSIRFEIKGHRAMSPGLLVQGSYETGEKPIQVRADVSAAEAILEIPANSRSYTCFLLGSDGTRYDSVHEEPRLTGNAFAPVEMYQANDEGWDFDDALLPASRSVTMETDQPTSKTPKGPVVTNAITEITRRNILDEMRGTNFNWSGRLDEDHFLARMFDVAKLPSYDRRCPDMASDIRLHRHHFVDWSDDWVYDDARLNIMHGDDSTFLNFLCETIHPVVRQDAAECEKWRKFFNEQLAADAFELVAHRFVSKRPIFTGRRPLTDLGGVSTAARTMADELDSLHISAQITRMEASIQTDPPLAIGTAKEFIETICKAILAKRGVARTGAEDVPKLVKLTREALAVDGSPTDDSVRKIMSGLATSVQGVTEVRGQLGTGHGPEPDAKVAEPILARLVVGTAVTLGVFLLDLHQRTEVVPLQVGDKIPS